MNKPEISIIMPSIRKDCLVKNYESIIKSTDRTFELLVIAPYSLPEELEQYKNIRLIRDFGSPIRASQIAASMCEGKFIYPTHADDCLMIEGALDKAIDLLLAQGNNLKNAVICKYSESQDYSAPERYQDDEYYKVVNAYPVNKNLVSKDWWIFNTVIMYRQYFEYLGGWRADLYQSCPMAHCDLAIRAQRDGCNVLMSPQPLIRCNHSQDDHSPIEISQVFSDTPVFKEVYNEPLENFPIRIPLLNWKLAPQTWSHRFK